MKQEEINSLAMVDLMDHLSDNTLKLLKTMNQKDANGILIRDLRIEVLLIQQAIENKKSYRA